ncbi:MAG: pentapeptide repeat-containing protein, partial [Myxococcota bacterium]
MLVNSNRLIAAGLLALQLTAPAARAMREFPATTARASDRAQRHAAIFTGDESEENARDGADAWRRVKPWQALLGFGVVTTALMGLANTDMSPFTPRPNAVAADPFDNDEQWWREWENRLQKSSSRHLLANNGTSAATAPGTPMPLGTTMPPSTTMPPDASLALNTTVASADASAASRSDCPKNDEGTWGLIVGPIGGFLGLLATIHGWAKDVYGCRSDMEKYCRPQRFKQKMLARQRAEQAKEEERRKQQDQNFKILLRAGLQKKGKDMVTSMSASNRNETPNIVSGVNKANEKVVEVLLAEIENLKKICVSRDVADDKKQQQIHDKIAEVIGTAMEGHRDLGQRQLEQEHRQELAQAGFAAGGEDDASREQKEKEHDLAEQRRTGDGPEIELVALGAERSPSPVSADRPDIVPAWSPTPFSSAGDGFRNDLLVGFSELLEKDKQARRIQEQEERKFMLDMVQQQIALSVQKPAQEEKESMLDIVQQELAKQREELIRQQQQIALSVQNQWDQKQQKMEQELQEERESMLGMVQQQLTSMQEELAKQRQTASVNYEGLDKELFDKDAKEVTVLVDRVKGENGKRLKNKLWGFIFSSEDNADIALVAANALTVLNAAGESFAGKDLRRIQVAVKNDETQEWQGPDLRGADLAGTNLTHADLRGARFNAADLDRCVLRHARLADARFAPRLDVDYALQPRVFQGHTHYVYGVAFSPDG